MTLVVSLLVAALVLVAGTAAVTAMLLGGGTTATSASSPTPDQPSPTPTGNRQQWSQAWLKGTEQAWTLEPPGTGTTSTIVRLTDDKLIRTTRQKEKGSVLVTVFRLGQGKPEQLWEEKITSTAPGTTIWNGKIIIGNNVIDINSRERSTALWGAEADTYAATGVGVTACSGTSCALWTSLTEKKWEATIPVSKQAYINTGSRVGRYVLAGGRADKDPNFSVNIDTGEVKKMEGSQSQNSPHALVDGWVIYDKNGNISIYKSDGTTREKFTTDTSRNFTTYPWSPNRFTIDQTLAWLKNGDTSWAPGTYSVSTTDPPCQSITVAGKDINLGKDNKITKKADGKCSAEFATHAFQLSEKGQISSYLNYEGDKKFLLLIDMTTGESSKPLTLGGRKTQYVVKDNLLIAYEESGKITAYRPR